MDALPQFALSIRQPWAWLILHAGKDIENRQWPTRFRGRVALHASKGMTRDEYEDCLATAHHISTTHPFPPGLTMPPLKELQRGGIVGTATITACVGRSDSPWFFGKYGFVLADPQPVAFVEVKGQLGFFEWRRNLPSKTEARR